MTRPQVKYTILNGGLGRLALPKDSITEYPIYNDHIADLTSFSTTNRVLKFGSMKQVEATGITADSTNFKKEHYTLSEYFRMGGGDIWVGVFSIPVTYDFSELTIMKNVSGGEGRQYMLLCDKELNSTDLGLINNIMKSFSTVKKPAHCIVGFNTTDTLIGSMIDLKNLAASLPYVSVVNGQDTQNYPKTYFDETEMSLPAVGTITGAVSSTLVSSNPLDHAKFNYSDAVNMVVPGFTVKVGTTPTLLPVNDPTVDEALLDTLNTKRYIYWAFEPNLGGTYLSNDNNCSSETDDYNSIHLVRTIQKAIRETDAKLSLLIGGPVKTTGGKLSAGTINTFTSYASMALNNMVGAQEISEYSVFIDPAQNVASTNTIEVEIGIVPIFSSDWINVSIGYTTGA